MQSRCNRSSEKSYKAKTKIYTARWFSKLKSTNLTKNNCKTLSITITTNTKLVPDPMSKGVTITNKFNKGMKKLKRKQNQSLFRKIKSFTSQTKIQNVLKYHKTRLTSTNLIIIKIKIRPTIGY